MKSAQARQLRPGSPLMSTWRPDFETERAIIEELVLGGGVRHAKHALCDFAGALTEKSGGVAAADRQGNNQGCGYHVSLPASAIDCV